MNLFFSIRKGNKKADNMKYPFFCLLQCLILHAPAVKSTGDGPSGGT